MMFTMIKRPVRIGNASGFIFDKDKCPIPLESNTSYLVEISIYPINERDVIDGKNRIN